jgi:hypothetical protein
MKSAALVFESGRFLFAMSVLAAIRDLAAQQRDSLNEISDLRSECRAGVPEAASGPEV